MFKKLNDKNYRILEILESVKISVSILPKYHVFPKKDRTKRKKMEISKDHFSSFLYRLTIELNSYIRYYTSGISFENTELNYSGPAELKLKNNIQQNNEKYVIHNYVTEMKRNNISDNILNEPVQKTFYNFLVFSMVHPQILYSIQFLETKERFKKFKKMITQFKNDTTINVSLRGEIRERERENIQTTECTDTEKLIYSHFCNELELFY